MMVSLGSTVKRRHGFVDDGCQDLIGGGFGDGLKLWIWVFFFFFWNLYSLFLSSNGLVCGNCKDLVRHTWSVAHSGLYRWLGRRVNQSG